MELSAIEQDSFGQNGLVQYTSEQSGTRRNIPVTELGSFEMTRINKPGLDMEQTLCPSQITLSSLSG
jgi:hypothetical protein